MEIYTSRITALTFFFSENKTDSSSWEIVAPDNMKGWDAQTVLQSTDWNNETIRARLVDRMF